MRTKETFKFERWSFLLSKYWFVVFSIGYGLYVGLPFLAPVFMHRGWEVPAKVIYTLYSFLCHQLPQRSFFIFGNKTMYSLAEIQAGQQPTSDPLILRQFIGNLEMGWKVAWSDRMVSMYSSILLAAWLWYPLRKKLSQIPFIVLGLFLLPMAIDGSTHLVSDFSGIGKGFRDTNQWLAALTDHRFLTSFYIGDAFGSLNSWLRLITGTIFGVGIVWYGFPTIEEVFYENFSKHKPRFNEQEKLIAR